MSAAQQSDRTGLVTAIDKSGGIYRFAKLLGVPHTVVCGWLVDEQQGGGELPQDEQRLDDLAVSCGAASMVSCMTHPKGPRVSVKFKVDDGSLNRFAAALAQRAASVPAQVGQEREAPDDLFDLIREWAHLPEGQRGNAARSIIGCVNRSYSAGVADGKVLGALAAPVPAASVQPFVPPGYANETEFLRQQLKDSRTANKAAQLVIAKLQAQQPDIGRDAALVEHGLYSELLCIQTAMEHMGDQLNNMDVVDEDDEKLVTPGFDALKRLLALATQAAPEVASVPDAQGGAA